MSWIKAWSLTKVNNKFFLHVKKRHGAPKLEMERMARSFSLDSRIPVARGVLKIHEGKVNRRPHRPELYVAGSPFHCMRRWVDMSVRESLDQTPRHVKNSNDSVLALK